MAARFVFLGVLVATASVLAATEAVQDQAVARIEALEDAQRAATDFAVLRPSDAAFGPDPMALVPVRGGFAGVLRGRDALVALDDDGVERARIEAPASPRALARVSDTEVLVVGELSPVVARFSVDASKEHGGLVARGTVTVPDVLGLQGVAVGAEGVAYVVEEASDTLVTLSGARVLERAHPCGGPLAVQRTGPFVVVQCFFDHALWVAPVDGRGVPRVDAAARLTQDGPFWGFTTTMRGGQLVLLAGGVEDHPLDRTEGSFGFIDSFVTVARAELRGRRVVVDKLQALNTSELGVVTPKALVAHDDGGLVVDVLGAASGQRVTLRFGALERAPTTTIVKALPGVVSAVRRKDGALLGASPLLDGWVVDDVLVPVPREPVRALDERVGEALFFTSLMAPQNKTEGRLSRFTCETCHFEGTVDGRTHHTGRGDIRATTKPLLGLFNNKPHFSRALDRDLSQMVHAEFRVAGAKSETDPWFTADVDSAPWLRTLGVSAPLSPEDLRRSLTTFLMGFTHRRSPAVVGRHAFDDVEKRGALVFAARCERCHAARLVADDPKSEVPFTQWEALVFSEAGPLVWGSDGYQKTGIEPYVHEDGARTPSLRRLLRKRPYFTNGAAKSLEDVVEGVRIEGDVLMHDAPTGAALTAEEQRALLAFLALL